MDILEILVEERVNFFGNILRCGIKLVIFFLIFFYNVVFMFNEVEVLLKFLIVIYNEEYLNYSF